MDWDMAGGDSPDSEALGEWPDGELVVEGGVTAGESPRVEASVGGEGMCTA